MLIDSHCHFSLIDQNKRSSIFHDMQEAGIGAFIEVGCDHERNLEALKIGTTFPHARIVLGYHPTDIQKSGDEVRIASMNTLAKQIQDNRSMIVGIGETGLDYHSLSPDNQEQEKNEQKKWFLAQGELAKQFQLPLVIHSRDADQDMMELLATIQPEKFVLHCYSSTPEFAHSILAKHPGAYFWFSGNITYRKSDAIRATIQSIPLDRILLETDAPFLSPEPLRGTENNPSRVRLIFEKVSEIFNGDRASLEHQIEENTFALFGKW